MMQYPSFSITLPKMLLDFVGKVADLRQIPKTTLIKDMFYDEITRPFYKQKWDEALHDYQINRDVVLLDSTLENYYISKTALEQLKTIDENLKDIIIAWLKAQTKESLNYFVCGYRLSQNENQWIYLFGEMRIMTLIQNAKIVIIGVVDSRRDKILDELIKQKEVEKPVLPEYLN